jgi:hypothetical protein
MIRHFLISPFHFWGEFLGSGLHLTPSVLEPVI